MLDIDLSMSARHQKTRVLLCARRLVCVAAACCSSSERRCAAQISKLQAMRVKQNNEFGPIRAPENNEFWRTTTAKLPLPVIAGLLSDQLEPTRPMQTPKKLFLFLFFHPSLLLFLKHHSSCQRLGSHGTSAALQVFPVVTVTTCASSCGFESVRVCARVPL